MVRNEQSVVIKFCKKCGVDTERNAAGNCKPCRSVANAKWQAANMEKVLAARAAYKIANPDKVRASKAAWREANRDRQRAASSAWNAANKGKMAAASAKWRAANHDKAKAAHAAWLKANPEADRVHCNNRRARKRQVGGRLSTGLAARLFDLQRGKCACGCRQHLGDDYHLDHIMPLALGGTNTDDNIQLLRGKCNQQKHAKHPVDFMQQRGFLL